MSIYASTIKRILGQLRHDHRTIGLLIVVPPLLLTLLYFMFEDTPPVFQGVALIMLGIFPFVIMFLITSIAMLLLAAGFETTVNLIGNGTALLTEHPEQLALLREDPSRWPNAVDEVLRHDSPVQRTGRIAHRDTEIAGERVRGGRIVVVMLGGANRDPAVFDDPGRFDVTRPNAGEHIAFSSGIHYCLGAALARMEGEVGLRALFERFPELALDGPPHRRPTRVLRGYDAMPARLTRATVIA